MRTSESQLEELLVEHLIDLKYDHNKEVRDRASLEKNFRKKFEELNRVELSDSEFARLLEQIVTPDVYAAASTLRERQSFERDDSTPLHFTLVNIDDWCKNSFEIISQLRINTESSHHRYDVILLINGVPVVQIELKTLQLSPRRAMQQIVDYKKDPGNGYTNTLLCFMQLFIVSNYNDTKYFVNNNNRHFSFNADERFLPIYEYADQDNNKITHLDLFAKAFLAKCTLSQMISKYMVLVASEQKLMMMRPYQIYAVKAIVECIHQNCGNGYIWHTTGSGKTLTSFKASTLLKGNPDIEKCLFVVDRKDLDRQTREEFNRFQAGCVEENTNTESLVKRLLSNDYADKVIVTTIQKLGLALDGMSGQKKKHDKSYKERLEPLSSKRIVFIFDECHRSQFGDNHAAIKRFFPNAQMFGFTGTPIFDDNATIKQVEGEEASYKTTVDLFQKQLHEYTITHAIEDKNVLRFHVDYYEPKGENKPQPGEPLSKQKVVETILEKHDDATAGRKFNTLLATATINDAIAYYDLFKSIQADKKAADPNFQPLNVACVFSPPAEGNSEIRQMQDDLPQEKSDNKKEPEKKKAALKKILADYNEQYKTSHTIGEFDYYYQDVQKRIKDQQYTNEDFPHTEKIDVTIVVEMLLTGFDSKYLNTLYVDRNLTYHGLIQAFSRTNRVLNDSKPYGIIMDFRQQEEAVKKAIALFSGEHQERAPQIWLVDKAPVVVEKLKGAVEKLRDFMESQDLKYAPHAVNNLKGDAARGQFINLFKEVQRLKTQLDQYTDLTDEDKREIKQVLPIDTLLGFRSMYLETARELKELQDKDGDSVSEATQQLDFEFVLFASTVIDYDYIMSVLAELSQRPPDKVKMTRNELIGLINADAKFIDERDDIAAYIETLERRTGLDKDAIEQGYEQFKARKDDEELATIAEKHELDIASLKTFVETILRRWIFDGEQLRELFTPMELGWKERTQRELALMEDLIPVLHKRAKGRDISGLSVYER